MSKTESQIKLCILGSNDFETLTFIRRIAQPFIESNSIHTIGVDFFVKSLSFNTDNKHINIRVNFWVLSRNDRFRFLIPIYFNESEGFIILLNLSEMKSYHDAKAWISLIREKFIYSSILILAYYIDEKEFNKNLIQDLVFEPDIHYLEISLDNEMEIKGSIIFLTCIILKLQIPYDISQKLNLTAYFHTLTYLKEPKEVLTQYTEEITSYESYRYNYNEFLQNISAILDNPDLQRIETHLKQLKDYTTSQEIKINSMKGRFLEMNTRILYEREYGYEVDYTERDFECTIDEIGILYNNGCIKNRETKDIQIDIFGRKTKYMSEITYLIGECKDRNKKISLKEIKCFLIKAKIIAKLYLYIHRRKKKGLPKFHLLIISLNGFPDKQKINKILEDIWHCNIPKKRLLYESIDLLERKKFVELLKKNNIPASDYKV